MVLLLPILLLATVAMAAVYLLNRDDPRSRASSVAAGASPTAVAPVAEPTAAASPTATLPSSTAVVEKAKTGPAVLSVSSVPSKAVVFVDGKRRGFTPAELKVAAGTHEVRVESRSYKRATRTIQLEPVENAQVRFKLDPRPARLIVRSGSRKVRLSLDGKVVGKGSLDRRLSPGRHTVTARAEGYHGWRRQVTLKPATTTTLTVRLKPQTSRLVVRSNRGGWTYLNGKRAGRGGFSRTVAPGVHRVRVVREGYTTYSARVRLAPGETRKLRARLSPRLAGINVLSVPNGSSVHLDGRDAGSTPETLWVRHGVHRITVHRDGYKWWNRSVRVRPGQTRKLRARLSPRLAGINVLSVPNGSSVHLDGRDAGSTPETLWVRHGVHRITVHRDGYKWWNRSVRVRPGQTLNLRAKLERRRRAVTQAPAAPLRHRPLAVMIENHPNARPQSGLDYADVVLEAPAEFGISRFIAFFISRDAPVVGPVRSAREYFILWAKEFNPIYYHAGGSPGAAGLADRVGLTRTSALWDSRGFYRTNDRIAPHNLYTSTKALLDVERARGRGLRSGSWGGLRFKRPGTQLGSERASYARLAFNDYYYAEWRWDPSRGVYSRWMQGEPHIERNTGAQVTATAVIVRVHQVDRVAGDDKARESIQVYGSGRAYIMQDGRLTRATWRKDDVKSPTLYYDAQGNKIRFNKGGIWIQVIPQYGSATFR